MKIPLSLLLLLLILQSLSAQPAKGGKLFIIGGGDRPASMIARLITESGLQTGGYGIILPMSSSTQDSSIYYAKVPFIAQGITNLYGIQYNNKNNITKAMADSVRSAKLIYICGGDQSLFMSLVQGTEIEVAIKEAFSRGTVIAGTSAGAAVMSDKMLTGNQKKYPVYAPTFESIEPDNVELTSGLGLANSRLLIDQHFVVRSRYNRLITAILENPALIGVGIDESTAILLTGNRAEVIGDSQVLVISCKSKTIRKTTQKLGAQALQLDVYLPGDKIRFPL